MILGCDIWGVVFRTRGDDDGDADDDDDDVMTTTMDDDDDRSKFSNDDRSKFSNAPSTSDAESWSAQNIRRATFRGTV